MKFRTKIVYIETKLLLNAYISFHYLVYARKWLYKTIRKARGHSNLRKLKLNENE